MRKRNAVNGKRLAVALAAALAAWSSPSPAATASSPDEAAFRALYKQLVEINTTLSSGSCTAAAKAMQARLLAAGLPAADTQVLVPPGRPKAGNLIVTYRG